GLTPSQLSEEWLVLALQWLRQRELFAFSESLPRRLPIAIPSTMRTLLIVPLERMIQILLQFFQRVIDLLAESDCVELLLERPIEAFTDAVSLWMARLGLAVINILQRQVELVLVMLN